MSSLEQMKKEDLVKLARSLQQDLKLAESKLEEVTPSEVVDTDEVETDLPFKACASVKLNKHKSIMVLFEFNLDGKVVMKDSSFGEMEHYKIQQRVDKYNADVVFRRNIVKGVKNEN